MPASDAETTHLQTACLLFILVLGALLRFYALEIPSMWWDEIYTPMTARYPAAYIWEWCRSLEIQPPYFYFAMKGVMAMGHSDFALRFLFAIAGLAAVPVTYRLGLKALGPTAGIGAAALLAFNPMFLWLSRTLRIYPLLHLGLAASLLAFLNAFELGRKRAEIGLYAINFGLLLLHYSAVLVVAAEFAVLVVWRVFYCRPTDWRSVFRFGVVSLLSFAPSAPFFFTGMVEGHKLDVHSSYQAVAARVTLLMGQNLTYFGLSWSPWIFVGLAVVGGVAVWRHNPKSLILLLLSVCLPPAAIVFKRYDSHFFAAHIAFLCIPLSVLAGAALARFRGRWGAAPLFLAAFFAVASAWWAIGPARGAFYAADSHDRRIFPLGIFKEIARAAPHAIGQDPVLCPDITQYNAINWYLGQFASPNPLTDQHLGRDRKYTNLLFWCGFDNFGHLANDKEGFRVRYPALETLSPLDTIRAYRLHIARAPLKVGGDEPSVLHLDAAPEHFYRDVAALSGVMLWPYFGNAVMPTANEAWGTFEYDIANVSPEAGTSVTLVAHYANRGRGSQVEVMYRLDGGAWLPAVASAGPDLSDQTVVPLGIDRPWHVLTVRCRLWCAPFTPLAGGSNLSTVIFKGLDLYACPHSDEADCQTLLVSQLLPQGFPAVEPVEQVQAEATNVTYHDSQESQGWGYYTPTDPTRAGNIRLRLIRTGDKLFFYPRAIGRQSSVVVAIDGAVNSLRGLPAKWTPLGLALPLPGKADPKEVDFRLEGSSAQLWTHDGQLVFGMPDRQRRQQ